MLISYARTMSPSRAIQKRSRSACASMPIHEAYSCTSSSEPAAEPAPAATEAEPSEKTINYYRQHELYKQVIIALLTGGYIVGVDFLLKDDGVVVATCHQQAYSGSGDISNSKKEIAHKLSYLAEKTN